MAGTPAGPTDTKREASLGELLGDLSRETITLVRQEVNLAKTEMTEKMGKLAKDIGFLAVGGAIAYAGLLFLLAALALILGDALDRPWLGALIVGLIVAAAGGALVMKGLKELKEVKPAPEQTIETLKEDKEWAQRQVRG